MRTLLLLVLLLGYSQCSFPQTTPLTPRQKLGRTIGSDPAMMHGSEICCLMVNDNQLTKEAKALYRADVYKGLKALLQKRYRLYSDTLQVRHVPEELQEGFYNQLVANRLYGDSLFQEINDLAIHHQPDTTGTVSTQLSLHFEEPTRSFYFLYEFSFRESQTAPWTSKRWRSSFQYCEGLAEPLTLQLLQDATIPPALLAERRRLAAAELRPAASSDD